MLIAVSILVISLGVFIEVAIGRKARRSPDFCDVPEGLQFVGYTMVALGAVVLYGSLSGQIVLPLYA